MSFVSNAVQSVLGMGGGPNGSYGAGALTTQPNLVNNINAAQGNIGQVYGQQEALAGNLQQQAAGQGPNLANALLTQATNANQQQAAGLLASQQGINPAMAAMSASHNLSQANQQAAQQASVNRMQQQLAAQQQLGGLYGQIGNQQLSNQQIMQNALTGQNSAINAQSGVNENMAAGNAGRVASGTQGLIGGLSGLSSLSGSSGGGGTGAGTSAAGGPGAGGLATLVAAKGGEVPSHLAGFAEMYGYGGQLADKGGKVDAKKPQQKASVSGDSLQNDKIPAMLSEHEIVIPREIAMHPDAPDKAREFVANIVAQHGKPKSDEESDFKSALKREAAKRKK